MLADEEMVWLCCLICGCIGLGSTEMHSPECAFMQDPEPYDPTRDFTPALREAA